MRLVSLDTETTGLEPGTSRMVSLAMRFSDVGTFSRVFNPGVPIPPEASAVHGFRDEDVSDWPPVSADSLREFSRLDERPTVVAIHNADFDVAILRAECARVGARFPDVPVLDTLRLARKLVPDAPNHKLATLHHMFRHDRAAAPNHSAAQDCAALELVARELILAWIDKTGSTSVSRLLDDSVSLELPETVAFGKWQGKPLSAVDFSYLHWWLFKRKETPDDSAFWTWAFASEFRRRSGPDPEISARIEAARRTACAPYRSTLPGDDASVFELFSRDAVPLRWEDHGDRFTGFRPIDSEPRAEIRPGTESRWVLRELPDGEPRAFARIAHAIDHRPTLVL